MCEFIKLKSDPHSATVKKHPGMARIWHMIITPAIWHPGLSGFKGRPAPFSKGQTRPWPTPCLTVNLQIS